MSAARDAFCLMLADAESALTGNADDRQWALDIPIPLLAEDAVGVMASELERDTDLRQRWDRVWAATDEDGPS